MAVAQHKETDPFVTQDLDIATTDCLSMLFDSDSNFDRNQQNDTSSFSNLDDNFSSLALTTCILQIYRNAHGHFRAIPLIR